MKKHMRMFSESYFTFSFPLLPKWNRAIFYAVSYLLKDGPGIDGPYQPNRDSTSKDSPWRRKTEQVSEQENVGTRERAEGCRS